MAKSIDIEKLDDLIRSGNAAEARGRLAALVGADIPPADRSRVAHLCVRAGDPELGLRLLRRWVAREGARPAPADVAEYALCLLRLGATREAKRWLASVKGSSLPQVLFYTALSEIAVWQFDRAVAPLEAYRAHPSVSPYQSAVASLNLASAFIFEGEFSRAHGLLEELRNVAQENGYSLIVANVHELTAACFIYENRYDDAREALRRAEAAGTEKGSLYDFFIQKWRAVLSLTDGDGARLGDFRRHAEARADWEALRECDRFEAILRRDDKLLAKVLVGTPYAHYRERVLRQFGASAGDVATTYDWVLAPGAKRAHDLLWGTEPDSPRLAMGRGSHTLLTALCSDFYRPFQVADLHETLFPGEGFFGDSSRKRVHAALKELRQWLAEHCPALAVEESSQRYRLVAREPFTLRVRMLDWGAGLPLPFVLLRQECGGEPFTPKWASERTAIPSRTLSRLFADGVEDGTLVKLGAGRSTRYRFAA